MKINHVVAHPPFREGTGTVAYYNARYQRELGLDALVYAAQHGSASHGDEPVDFCRFMTSYLSLGNAFLTPQIVGMRRADMIHLHYPFIFGSDLTILKSALDRTPMVLTYHNDLIGSGIRRPSFWVYHRTFAPWILNQAKKIAVTSLDHAATTVFANTIFARRSADIVEVGNGVEVDVFRPDVDCAFVRSKYDLGADDFILLFISFLDRSHARKGLGLLLDALAEIKNARIKLIVAGDGNMRAEYQQQAINLGIDRRVVFAGHLPHTELPAYAAACDAVCIPSLPPESFGVALAEGMASGKPVIASDIPGVRSLVQPECGFLIPPGDRSALIDRIQTLAEDHTLRARMGAAGRERILTRYTWRKAAETLRSMYQSVFATA